MSTQDPTISKRPQDLRLQRKADHLGAVIDQEAPHG
jgi:hypothetical protein